MSTPRLDTLTYDQLCELSARVDAQKATAYKQAEKARQEMRATLDRMLAVATQARPVTATPVQAKPATINAPVITPTPVKINGIAKRKSTKGKRAPIKFRSGSHTWSGRGKTPAWLAQLEKAGQPRAQFAVK